MPKYIVKVTGTFRSIIELEADNESDADEKAMEYVRGQNQDMDEITDFDIEELA